MSLKSVGDHSDGLSRGQHSFTLSLSAHRLLDMLENIAELTKFDSIAWNICKTRIDLFADKGWRRDMNVLNAERILSRQCRRRCHGIAAMGR